MLKNHVEQERPGEEELGRRLEEARKRLGALQMQIKEHGLPVLVLMEGWGTAGKGSTIGKIIRNIDPRFFKVATMAAPTEEELRKPFLYRYFARIPEAGKFTFLDSGWMDEITGDVLQGKLDDKGYASRIDSVKRFERQLTDNGYLVMKFFFHIDEKEQRKRLDALLVNKDTSWRVSDSDRWQNKHYDKCLKVFDRYLDDTNVSTAPWYIVDAHSRKWAQLQVLEMLCQGIDVALQNKSLAVPLLQNTFPLEKMPKLGEIALDKTIEEAEYQEELDKLQKRLGELHNRLYRKRVPVIIAYEGWDAAGRAAISNGSPGRWIPEALRCTPSPARSRMRRRAIISGVSGPGFPRPGILQYLTEPGTAASWWRELRVSAVPTTGSVPITKSMSSKRSWWTGARWSLSSGCILIRIPSWSGLTKDRTHRKSSGKLRMRTGETGKNGMPMNRRSMR